MVLVYRLICTRPNVGREMNPFQRGSNLSLVAAVATIGLLAAGYW